MKTSNTPFATLRKSLVIALAVAGMGGALSVHAQTAQSAPQPGRHASVATQEQHHARWAEHAAKRQARLHDSLKLTPAQEPAWATFVAASKPALRGDRQDRSALRGLSAPARMEKHIAMAKEHIGVMETRLAALNSFYAVLTPEQKKLFDDNSMRGRGHGKHGGHGRHGRDKMPA